MVKLFVLSASLCAAFLAVCSAEAGYSQDTYISALQSSHGSGSQDIEPSIGYEYTQPTPNNKYLPAPPVYGPPAPVYGPPPTHFYKPAPPMFHPREDWLEKIKSKINLFTIGKILLKLLIFKKMIKFIGVICLLLFLPKLKDMFKTDDMMDEESKSLRTDKDILTEQIDELHKFALKAFASFQE